MSDKEPPKPDEPGVPDSPSDCDLSGLTKAIGGLDPAVADHDPLEGAIIGEVKIKRLIAEGGMGRVYEGLQDKPRRPVAVKIMRPGFVSREACRRFDNESEVLGRLRHPYIAQIYSAGICTIVGAQVPYFVMEFVPDALPITKYAAAKKLSTNDRIELFRKVCEAVAHGHEKNVIHRDLKPSNILVEPNGVPKIIDFGVARCVDASPEEMTAMTDMGQLIGTVQYMSPEQFSGNPTNVDVRADVYALGVILYELLANRPPYEIRQKEIFEAARVVRDYKPVSPAKFNLNLTADVVRITGTCLQKDRRRRYANAVELQGALADYLGGKPVLDRNPGWLGSVITQARDWAGNIPVRLTVGLALAGLVATIGAWLFFPISPPETQLSFQFNGHSYCVFLEPVTWGEAQKSCEAAGGVLARVETAAENKAIVAAIQARNTGAAYLWIDGFKAGPDDAWSYGDKTPVAFFARNPEETTGSSNGPRSLAIGIVPPVSYWAAVDSRTRANGFVCEWNDETVK
ncbi:MAG: protein kinase [Planctomycetes bacterium]|nr:protein kinase [Planctomycetota bacterium]